MTKELYEYYEDEFTSIDDLSFLDEEDEETLLQFGEDLDD